MNRPVMRPWETALSGFVRRIDDRRLPRTSCIGPDVGTCRRAETTDVLQHLLEADADDELHRVVADTVLFAIVEDRHDVGVVQPGRRASLGLESPHVGAVGTEARVHDFERHPALERHVLGLVDDSHAPTAKLAQQRVVAQPPGAIAGSVPFAHFACVARAAGVIVRQLA